MFRNCLSTAWGDLVRNPLQSIIAIGGLAVGLAAAILAGVVAANQFSFDNFISGHDRLYYAVLETHGSAGDAYALQTPHDLAAMLRDDFPQIEAVTRISRSSAVMRHGVVMAKESFYWADPNFFDLMALPVLYGNLQTALTRPDGIVIPLTIARKYFGRDNAVGQTLELDHQHVMTITAVIADLPSNASTLVTGTFASSLAAFSTMAKDAGRPGMSPDGSLFSNVNTLVRLRPGASLDALDRDSSAMVAKFVPSYRPYRRAMHFERLDRLHLSPQVNPGIRQRLSVLAAAALMILVLACANFVNLSVARTTQRGLEVAVRKVVGAQRGNLVVQFLGESILKVLFALCMAVMLVELSLPAVNAFLNSGALLDYWRDPQLIAILLAGGVAVGITAGAYPALILSAFRPVSTLKGLMRGTRAGDLVRQILVALQFIALIMLLIAAMVVYRQNRFVTTEALRVDTDQMLMINMPACNAGLRDRVAALPGVRGAVCSSQLVLPDRGIDGFPALPRHGGIPGLLDGYAGMATEPVDFGFFELYGVRPVAGRLFRPGSGDEVPPNPAATQTAHYVINQTAVRQLGFSSPEAAIGQMLNFVDPNTANNGPQRKSGGPPPTLALRGVIVGVVPDFSLTPSPPLPFSNSSMVWGVAYSVGMAVTNRLPPPSILHVRLNGRNIPETLTAIDTAWKQSGAADPIDRTFLSAYVQNLEIAVLRLGQAFAIFAGIAMLLACLGLLGLSLSVTARRTKEIGVRKAMGATTGEIVALLLWQFSQPVLWANLLAWPLAWWVMREWLAGFVDHVSLPLWLFPAAGAASLGIALVTVASQAILVARQKPVTALRYE
jgi:putative ABC transport system permease protein